MVSGQGGHRLLQGLFVRLLIRFVLHFLQEIGGVSAPLRLELFWGGDLSSHKTQTQLLAFKTEYASDHNCGAISNLYPVEFTRHLNLQVKPVIDVLLVEHRQGYLLAGKRQHAAHKRP